MGTGIFTEFTRQSAETIIKKSKTFKQINFLKCGSEHSLSSSAHGSVHGSLHSGSNNYGFPPYDGGKLSGKNTAATAVSEP